MKWNFVIACMVVFLSGCASSGSSGVWSVDVQEDEFTDKKTFIVIAADSGIGGRSYTKVMHYYPVVGRLNDGVYIGLMSGGKVKAPVGDIQIRVDQNKAWDISLAETPEDLIPKGVSMPAIDYGLQGEQADLVNRVQDQAMANYKRYASPITAVGGDKAKEIIKQMISGKKIIYRSQVIGLQSSTTGSSDIDDSFVESLVAIGINPEDL